MPLNNQRCLLQAFAKGLHIDPDNPDLKEGAKEARQLLSTEQLQMVESFIPRLRVQ